MNRIYGWKQVDGGRMEGKSLFPWAFLPIVIC